jgi:hypothetical protein
MTISLSQMIADLNAKIAAADSNTPIATILQYVTEAERLGGGKIIYDNSAALPSDSAYEGMIAYVADDATLKVRGDYGWAGIADSASVFIPNSPVQGSVSGYASGGLPTKDIIDKFPFSTDANATDVGDLTVARGRVSGQSSSVSGYTSGGFSPAFSPTSLNIIDKFPFSVDANATDVGDLTRITYSTAGHSSETDGYVSGGLSDNTIDKFPFASDANSTDHGDLLTLKSSGAGNSSTTHGYHSGGIIPGGNNDVIEKFPFANTSGSTDVGVLVLYNRDTAGQSSSTNGYSSGGRDAANIRYNIIQKFPFATDANATDVGDLTVARRDMLSSGQSSTVSGYTAGGDTVSPTISDIIDKFPFATDANATDVGDLTVARNDTAGQQV